MFFLFAEDLLQKKIRKYKFFDDIASERLTGGISASIAIFVSTYIGLQIKKKYNIYESFLYYSFGLLIGTLVVLLIYKLFNIENKRKTKD